MKKLNANIINIFKKFNAKIAVLFKKLNAKIFSVLTDLDETGIRCQKIGIVEIPEMRFVLQTGFKKKLPLAIVFVSEFVMRFDC